MKLKVVKEKLLGEKSSFTLTKGLVKNLFHAHQTIFVSLNCSNVLPKYVSTLTCAQGVVAGCSNEMPTWNEQLTLFTDG